MPSPGKTANVGTGYANINKEQGGTYSAALPTDKDPGESFRGEKLQRYIVLVEIKSAYISITTMHNLCK